MFSLHITIVRMLFEKKYNISAVSENIFMDLSLFMSEQIHVGQPNKNSPSKILQLGSVT